ncbi:AraC family transcriptional regulator [Acidaminobacter sp. JC074]|uniref:AraC family transcriptional regulator n=1 Tax=Acidaminobacter sp. JC074 TaxID=2530199 RepID=UPI001F0D0794|nr:AraC family transcriptional regulator [Acidaminobacter sp. JC074]
MFILNNHTIVEFPLDPFDQLTSEILYAGKEACQPNHFRTGLRSNYLIHYILEGKGQFCLNNETYNLKENDAFIIQPHQLCQYKAHDKKPWSYIWIGFSCNHSLKDHLPNVIYNLEKSTRDILLNLNTTYLSDDSQTAKNYFIQKSQLFSMLSQLILDKPFQHQELDKDESYIKDALSYIHLEYATDMSIEGLASHLSISRKHLSAVFKRHLKVSPKHYLIMYRLYQAKKALKNTHHTIKNIALDVGYKDVYQFSRLFSKYENMSPSLYREKNKTR